MSYTWPESGHNNMPIVRFAERLGHVQISVKLAPVTLKRLLALGYPCEGDFCLVLLPRDFDETNICLFSSLFAYCLVKFLSIRTEKLSHISAIRGHTFIITPLKGPGSQAQFCHPTTFFQVKRFPER